MEFNEGKPGLAEFPGVVPWVVLFSAMKVTIWGINYAPEVTGIAPYNLALAEHLRRQGHEVRMVTSFAYYPAWRKQDGDSGRLYRTDQLNGVSVHRCWHYVPRRVSTIKRILHEGTFVLFSLLRLLTLPRPDVYVVVSPPLLLGCAAWILTWFKRSPYLFHVQDLQPDAAVGLGMLKPSRFTQMLYWLEAKAYRHAARVSGISQGMLDAFTRKGVPSSRQIYFPNGVKLPAAGSIPAWGQFRQRAGFGKDEFLAVYSGNLGLKQGLEILVEAARALAGSAVRLVICGDGAARPRLEAAIREQGLGNLTLLPLQPEEGYREMLVDADVCLITQQAGSGAAFFPSKLLPTLAYGRAVVGVADDDSELRRAIRQGEFGECVQPGEAGRLAQVLRGLAEDPETREAMGRSGRRFVEQFEFTEVLSRYARDLAEVTNSHQP